MRLIVCVMRIILAILGRCVTKSVNIFNNMLRKILAHQIHVVETILASRLTATLFVHVKGIIKDRQLFASQQLHKQDPRLLPLIVRTTMIVLGMRIATKELDFAKMSAATIAHRSVPRIQNVIL